MERKKEGRDGGNASVGAVTREGRAMGGERLEGGVALRKGELDGEREGAQEPEMEAGEGVGVLIALKRSGLFVCLPLL